MQACSLLACQGPVYSLERKAGEDLSRLAMGIYNANVYVLDTPLLDICMPLLLMDTEESASADKT